MKLTPKQREVLTKMRDNPLLHAAYALKASISTLKALEHRDLISADRSRPGCTFYPSIMIVWKITDKGRAALEEQVSK